MQNQILKENLIGNLFVVAAASGAGKSSLVRALREHDPAVFASVSHTTRAPRGQEQNGREYFFVSEAEFETMVEQNAFVEWANVHGRHYGTSKAGIVQRLAQGEDVLLEIDYQGALQVRTAFPEAALIFILPPSWEELRARLEGRGEDAAEVIEMRLKNAAHEMRQVDKFDFVIINDSFDAALLDLQTIVRSQRLRGRSQRHLRSDVFQSLGL